MSDEKIGLSYVETMFQTNNDLIINFSNYCSSMASFEQRKKESESQEINLSEEEVTYLLNVRQLIKTEVIFIYKYIKSLTQHLNKLSKEDKESYEKVFKKLRDSAIPSVDDLDLFTDFTNSFIVGSAVNDIFENKVKKMNDMFKNEEKNIKPEQK